MKVSWTNGRQLESLSYTDDNGEEQTLVSLGVIICHLIRTGTNINTVQKYYNMIWSNNGIDRNDSKKYCLFRVTKEKAYNGWYAMTNKGNGYKKL